MPLDAGKLRQGQPILIYATLENFHSMATAKGYRTLTLSTLEVQTADGGILQRQALGPAVDLTEVPRRDFFLTHLVTIPEDLPPGDYIFNLCVDDLLKHGSAHARIAVRITEDRTPRSGCSRSVLPARFHTTGAALQFSSELHNGRQQCLLEFAELRRLSPE